MPLVYGGGLLAHVYSWLTDLLACVPQKPRVRCKDNKTTFINCSPYSDAPFIACVCVCVKSSIIFNCSSPLLDFFFH